MISRRSRCCSSASGNCCAISLREIAAELAAEIGIVRHVRIEQIGVERQLGIGQQHRQLRPRQRLLALRRARRSPCRPAGTRPRGRARRAAPASASAAAGSRGPPARAAAPATAPASADSCCAAPAPRPRRSSRRAARCASSMVSRPSRTGRLSAILILTSTSEVLTPAELSMASVLSRTPCSAASMRPRWVMPRLAPSPITLARSRAPVMRIAIVGAVAGRLVALRRGAHIGADAAEEQQIDRRLQDRVHHLLRRRLGLGETDRAPAPPATARFPSASAERRRRPWRSASCRSPASSSAAARTGACARQSSFPDRDRDR